MNIENKREHFIDLHCIASASFRSNQKVVIFFQYEQANNPTLIYLMRKAIGNVGYTINRIERTYGHDGSTMNQIEFHTDIPSEVWNQSTRIYNEWVEQVGLDH